MKKQAVLGCVAAIGLAGCAASDPFGSSRSVFYNPYETQEIANGPVGPLCAEGVLRDNACWIDGVAYPTDGRFARLPDGSIVRLDRNQRRWARERAEAIEGTRDVLESLENGTPIPPDSPALRENQSRPAPLPAPNGSD